MKPANMGEMMAEMAQNFNANDCEGMMKEMPVEMREKCMQMMTSCLNAMKNKKET